MKLRNIEYLSAVVTVATEVVCEIYGNELLKDQHDVCAMHAEFNSRLEKYLDKTYPGR